MMRRSKPTAKERYLTECPDFCDSLSYPEMSIGWKDLSIQMSRSHPGTNNTAEVTKRAPLFLLLARKYHKFKEVKSYPEKRLTTTKPSEM